MDIIKLEGFNNIYYLERFQKEWESLFKKDNKTKKRYEVWLNKRLHQLDCDAMLFTRTDSEHFEYVVNSNPQICSIHGRSKKNPRVLYYIVNSQNQVILLTAFIEKSNSDYDKATKLATNRIKGNLKGEDYDRL